MNSEPGVGSDWVDVGADANFVSGDNVSNIQVTDGANDFIVVSGTYTGGDKTQKSSYSLNSIFRQL